jgi:hypothetical protein
VARGATAGAAAAADETAARAFCAPVLGVRLLHRGVVWVPSGLKYTTPCPSTNPTSVFAAADRRHHPHTLHPRRDSLVKQPPLAQTSMNQLQCSNIQCNHGDAWNVCKLNKQGTQ